MSQLRRAILLGSITAIIGGSVALYAIEPIRWHLSGSNPAGFESAIDSKTKFSGSPTTYLKAKTEDVVGFGTLMFSIRAAEYRGKRIRLTAQIKTNGVRQSAGLWMRIDKSPDVTPLAFDNMSNRPIHGSLDWHPYDIVLDAPSEASTIFFGVMLEGSGKVWIGDVNLSTVGQDVPTTGMPIEKQKWQPQHPHALEPGWKPIYD